MPSSTVNICVLTLVLLFFQQVCDCRPHRSKRGLVKDYQIRYPDTLIFSSDKFEKGEDGKYYLKQSAHRQDSEVNYIPADDAGAKDSAVPDISEVETVKDESKSAAIIDIKTDPIIKELSEKEAELIPGSPDAKDAAEKIDIKDEKATFIPVDTKFTVPPKPDAKDEVALKTDPFLLESAEKEKEKVSIGQVPELSSRLVPVPENVRVPILIPIRHISYRAMKIIPLPPADISDRLPIPYEDDIVGEGAHESESEEVSQPISAKESGYPIGNPLVSLFSFHNVLKELKEADKGDAEKESKVIDVLGKKFLMQSNVMKYPSSDNGHTFIRFLSMKPLDEVKPEVARHFPAEETLKKESEVEERKSIEKKEKEESAAKEKEMMKKEKDTNESEAKKEVEEKLPKEADILKAEETELKMKFEKNVPIEVMMKNAGNEEAEDKMEDSEDSVEDLLKETDEHKMPHPEMKDIDLKVVMESKEMGIAEKAESQLEVKEIKDIEMKRKEDKKKEINEEDYDSMLKTMKDEKAIDEKMEPSDILMKKYEEKKMEMESKKDLFLLEKKKKEKSMEEMEQVKHKKKNDKKKKKIKCEEKDSDSDDDVDE